MFVEKGMKRKEIDIINIAMENIKNIICVMKVENMLQQGNEIWNVT